VDAAVAGVARFDEHAAEPLPLNGKAPLLVVDVGDVAAIHDLHGLAEEEAVGLGGGRLGEAAREGVVDWL